MLIATRIRLMAATYVWNEQTASNDHHQQPTSCQPRNSAPSESRDKGGCWRAGTVNKPMNKAGSVRQLREIDVVLFKSKRDEPPSIMSERRERMTGATTVSG